MNPTSLWVRTGNLCHGNPITKDSRKIYRRKRIKRHPILKDPLSSYRAFFPSS